MKILLLIFSLIVKLAPMLASLFSRSRASPAASQKQKAQRSNHAVRDETVSALERAVQAKWTRSDQNRANQAHDEQTNEKISCHCDRDTPSERLRQSDGYRRD